MDANSIAEAVRGINQVAAALGEVFTPGRVLALGFIYCCVVQGLPAPVQTDGRIYKFFYRTAHIFAGNINLARKPFKPGDDTGVLPK